MAVDLRLLRYFVAVVEERHVGRAAARLHMAQPPLSRAIKVLEAELGVLLLHRSSTGVTPTTAGTLLHAEARTLLEQAERVRARIGAAAGPSVMTLGVLADSADQGGAALGAAFRSSHPGVEVRIREADFTDPTTGLRAGLVDVALTRAPFDQTGISTRVLRTDPVGVVLRADDPLAGRDQLHLRDLAGRPWFQLPDGTDPLWRAYWKGGSVTGEVRRGPVVRTVQECLQDVSWNGTVGLVPLAHALPEGLTSVPLADFPPSDLVIAWRTATTDPLIRSFVRIAARTYRANRTAVQTS